MNFIGKGYNMLTTLVISLITLTLGCKLYYFQANDSLIEEMYDDFGYENNNLAEKDLI